MLIPKLKHPILRSAAVSTLLAMYFGVLLHSSLHHTASHHHEREAVCSSEHKLDACHMSVHHMDQDNGCKHTSHFSEETFECEFCDAAPFKNKIVHASIDGRAYVPGTASVSVKDQEVYCAAAHSKIQQRGPPALV